MPNNVSVADFLPIDGETSYYAIVIATNRAGLTTVVSSEAFNIDVTPPVAGTVRDGIERDWEYINSSVSLATTWFGFEDPETGIEKCTLVVMEESLVTEFSVKATAILTLVVNASGSIIHNNLTLTSGLRYISKIECSNPGGLKTEKSSDGVIVDDSPPIVSTIKDGTYLNSDIQYQSSTDTLNANWVPALEPESGIKEYLVAVGSGSDQDDIREFFSVGLATDVKITNLTLVSGSSYYVTLEIVNNAGLRSRVSTNGVTVDSSPPVLSEVGVQ